LHPNKDKGVSKKGGVRKSLKKDNGYHERTGRDYEGDLEDIALRRTGVYHANIPETRDGMTKKKSQRNAHRSNEVGALGKGLFKYQSPGHCIPEYT